MGRWVGRDRGGFQARCGTAVWLGGSAGRAARREGGARSITSPRPRREENRDRFQPRTPITRGRIRPIMKALGAVFRLGLVIGLGIEIAGWPTTAAQTTAPKDAPSPAPGLRKLTGDDARRA